MKVGGEVRFLLEPRANTSEAWSSLDPGTKGLGEACLSSRSVASEKVDLVSLDTRKGPNPGHSAKRLERSPLNVLTMAALFA